jgi:uncharacterized protein YecA (UPF0149 family)
MRAGDLPVVTGAELDAISRKVARLREPEQFYLPAEFAQALHQPWTPANTWLVLDPLLKAEQAGRKPGTGAASIGRQDPCPCGSGRKWVLREVGAARGLRHRSGD